MDENGLGLRTLALNFDSGECSFQLEDEHGVYEVKCGDGKWVNNITRTPGMIPTMFSYLHDREKMTVKVAASGGWIDENTYQMRWQYLVSPHFDLVTCHLEADRLELNFQTHFGELEALLLPGIENQFKGTLEQEPQ
jgi:hypothetical protein